MAISERYEFHKATLYGNAFMFECDPHSFEAVAVREPVASFVKAMLTVNHLGSLPLQLVARSILVTDADVRARAALGIPLDGTQCQIGAPDYDAELTARKNERAVQLQMEWYDRHGGKGAKSTEAMRTIGSVNANTLIDADFQIAAAFQAILASMLIGAWTAFEALCIDLWKEMLNHGPKELITNAYKKSNPREQEKQISISVLHQYGFDLRTAMGSILARKKDFHSFAEIKAGYAEILGAEATEIFDKSQYSILSAISSIRNLLAHRSGRVDADFVKEMEPFTTGDKPMFSPLAIESFFECSGPLVSAAMTAVQSCASELALLANKTIVQK